MDEEMKFTGGGFVTAHSKIQTIGGIETGIVEGYIASKKREDGRWPDEFRGFNVFGDSIQEHKARNNRPVRLNFMHERDPIGQFPIETVREDERGLFGVAHLNLEIEKARDVYSLARQGSISDFSIGWSVPGHEFISFEDHGGVELRVISKVDILEGSLVDEPMNRDALVTAVKSDSPLTIDSLKGMSEREMETILSASGTFSRKVVKALVARLKPMVRAESNPALLSKVLAELQGMRADLKAVA